MEHLEKFEEQLIDSYESTLAAEGKEICEEIDSLLGDDIDLFREKARTYCYLCTSLKKDVIDAKLFERCEKYLDNLS